MVVRSAQCPHWSRSSCGRSRGVADIPGMTPACNGCRWPMSGRRSLSRIFDSRSRVLGEGFGSRRPGRCRSSTSAGTFKQSMRPGRARGLDYRTHNSSRQSRPSPSISARPGAPLGIPAGHLWCSVVERLGLDDTHRCRLEAATPAARPTRIARFREDRADRREDPPVGRNLFWRGGRSPSP